MTNRICYAIIKVQKRDIKELKIMTSYAIPLEWYNEIKDRVPHGEPYFYEDKAFGRTGVEVDVDEDIFNQVSKELGWM